MAESETRTLCLKIYVSPSEKEMIEMKMLRANTANLSAFARSMIINGYVIHSDFSEIRELIKIMRSISTNINQIALRVNSTKSIYESDVTDLKSDMKKLKLAVMDHLIALIERK